MSNIILPVSGSLMDANEAAYLDGGRLSWRDLAFIGIGAVVGAVIAIGAGSLLHKCMSARAATAMSTSKSSKAALRVVAALPPKEPLQKTASKRPKALLQVTASAFNDKPPHMQSPTGVPNETNIRDFGKHIISDADINKILESMEYSDADNFAKKISLSVLGPGDAMFEQLPPPWTRVHLASKLNNNIKIEEGSVLEYTVMDHEGFLFFKGEVWFQGKGTFQAIAHALNKANAKVVVGESNGLVMYHSVNEPMQVTSMSTGTWFKGRSGMAPVAFKLNHNRSSMIHIINPKGGVIMTLSRLLSVGSTLDIDLNAMDGGVAKNSIDMTNLANQYLM